MHQTNRISRPLQAIVATAAALFLLTACASGSESEPAASSTTSASASSAPEETTAAADVDDSAVEADLAAAAGVVDTAVAEYPDATQVILTSTEGPMDIQYGAVSAYFVPSDATEDVTGTIAVSAGAYTISGTSVESGITYVIDETGTVTAE